MLIQNDSQSGGFGSKRNTIREGIKNIESSNRDDIYNSMVKCYIENIRTKIMNNTKHDENLKIIIFSLITKYFIFVTNNNLFESMVTKKNYTTK